jgi:hypothetical protein
MNKFKLPSLPTDPSEIMGRGLQSFLRGAGIDPASFLDVARGIFEELEKLNARLERIERANEEQQIMDLALSLCLPEYQSLMQQYRNNTNGRNNDSQSGTADRATGD